MAGWGLPKVKGCTPQEGADPDPTHDSARREVALSMVPDARRLRGIERGTAKRMILRQPSAPSIPQRIMSASEFRIDVLGMPNNPPYGTSMSRITNIALVTDMAHNAMTMVLRVFGGARKPKVPNKMRSQNTKTQ